MAHMVKCSYCDVMFDRDKEPFVPDGGRRYMHKACAEKKDRNLTEEEKDLKQLYQYIKELFKTTYISKKIENQIVDYRKTYGYSYSGMQKTLYWWFEIKKNSLNAANGGIGIIPFVYGEAETYYKKIYFASIANSNETIKNYKSEIKEVYINAPKIERTPKKLFNLEMEDLNE